MSRAQLKTLEKVRRLARVSQAVYLSASVIGIAVVFYPAVLNAAVGGLLEKLLPPAVYNAIHELRHLLGIPCH